MMIFFLIVRAELVQRRMYPHACVRVDRNLNDVRQTPSRGSDHLGQ